MRLDTLVTSSDKKNIRIHPSTRYRIRCGFIFFHSGPVHTLSDSLRIYFFHSGGPVHTYPDIFESATFFFQIRLPFTRIRRIRQRIWKKINPLSRVEKNISAANPITCGRVNPDIFLSDDVKSMFSLSPNNKPIWRHNVEGEQSKFPAAILLYGACSEDILVQWSLGY